MKGESWNRQGCTQTIGLLVRGDSQLTAEVVPVLLNLLKKDRDIAVRMSAAEAIRRIGKGAEAAVPELIKVLDDPLITDEPLRDRAIMALGSLGPHAAPSVPTLVKILTAGRPEEVRQAVITLGNIGHAARDAIPAIKASRAFGASDAIRAIEGKSP